VNGPQRAEATTTSGLPAPGTAWRVSDPWNALARSRRASACGRARPRSRAGPCTRAAIPSDRRRAAAGPRAGGRGTRRSGARGAARRHPGAAAPRAHPRERQRVAAVATARVQDQRASRAACQSRRAQRLALGLRVGALGQRGAQVLGIIEEPRSRAASQAVIDDPRAARRIPPIETPASRARGGTRPGHGCSLSALTLYAPRELSRGPSGGILGE
jgi:hypothetical protein